MKKILVLISNGFEEIEAVASIDVLRRAGADVLIASVSSSKTVIGANNITIVADCLASDCKFEDFDALLLPGGFNNAQTLASDTKSQELIKSFYSSQKYVCAICAAPIALYAAGVLNCTYTCYPNCEQGIKSGNFVEDRVVVDKKIITSRGPGTAICFALEIVKEVISKEKYEAVKNGMLANC